MTNSNDRKEYRKNLKSGGQLYAGGEVLEIKSYDVSVKGIMVEVFPGKFLSSINDFQALSAGHGHVEIFVDELKLCGEATIAWVRMDDDKILLGLEYRDVEYNAEKLWLKRLSYRHKKPFVCTMLLNHGEIELEGIDVSVDGLALKGNITSAGIAIGDVVKLKFLGLIVEKALAKVIWINENGDGSQTAGFRYMEID